MHTFSSLMGVLLVGPRYEAVDHIIDWLVDSVSYKCVRLAYSLCK